MLATLRYLKRHLNIPNIVIKRNKSALFITNDKANETFSVLTPHLDFDERLKEIDKLKENIKLRALPINLDEIVSVWIFYKKFETQKKDLEISRVNIMKTIKQLSQEKDAEEIEKLKTHGRMIKDDLKAIRDSFYSVEENAVLKALSIPNVLHEKTPDLDEVIFHTFKEITVEKSESHLNLAKDLIEYSEPNCYYLKKEAAEFELSSTFYITDYLLNLNYTQFSNSDFTRSVIVEGCGTDFLDPKQVFTLSEPEGVIHENFRLHLTGGASLHSFMAFNCKNTIFPSLLPLKYFTVGRSYSPFVKNHKECYSLFNVTQETAVNLFVATKDDVTEMNLEFERVLTDVIKLYESFNVHFRCRYAPANELKSWESLRVDFQMYSPSLMRYIDVGYVSICDNYLSKRLLFNYGKGFDMNFPRIISGCIYRFPRVLACLIESNERELIRNNIERCFC